MILGFRALKLKHKFSDLKLLKFVVGLKLRMIVLRYTALFRLKTICAHDLVRLSLCDLKMPLLYLQRVIHQVVHDSFKINHKFLIICTIIPEGLGDKLSGFCIT